MNLLRSILSSAQSSAWSGSDEADAVRRIAKELSSLPEDGARFLAAFAFLLARVAHADLEVRAGETEAMERLVREEGGLPEAQAALAVEIAKHQSRLFGGTQHFQASRELRAAGTREQLERTMHCLFAVAAADGAVSSVEDEEIRRVGRELGFSHREFVALRAPHGKHRSALHGLPSTGVARTKAVTPRAKGRSRRRS